MKSFIVFALFVAAAVAVPVDPKEAVVVRQETNNIGVEGFNYVYETSNGIKGEEQGQLADVGTPDEGIAVRGQFSYVGPDGATYAVTYVADKFGFQPQGAHLPKP